MNYPSASKSPYYLSEVRSWHRHIPFAYDLVCNFRPKKIVELGVHFGDSYFNFCQSVKDHNIDCECFGIDTWEGEKHAGFYGEEVWKVVDEYNSKNYSEFSFLIRNTFNSSLNIFKDSTIDLLHIDGLHTYDAVSNDFYNWWPKLSQNGIILIHDIVEKNNGFEVWKFWDELKSKYKCFQFNFGHGLGVIVKSTYEYPNAYIREIITNHLACLYYEAKSEALIFKNTSKQLQYENKQNRLEIKTYINEIGHISSALCEYEQNLNLTIKERVSLEDKIKRLKNSFSWKFTAPLRYLRRKLLDPFFKKEPIFDAKTYLDLNPDLNEFYDGDLKKAEEHYRIHGKKEGRIYIYPPTNYSYKDWIRNFDLITEFKFQELVTEYRKLILKPLISIIIPVFNIKTKIFLETIQSVKNQIYENWELIIVDDCSTNIDLKRTLYEISLSDQRIKLIVRNENGHISEASNTGIENSTGEFIVFLDHDDLLREHSLLRVVQKINQYPDCKLIYTDEDKIDLLGDRVSPYFKPDWNPDLLLGQNFICHLCCIKASIVKRVFGFRKGFEGCQDWDLFLRVTEIIEDHEIFHIPEILYHWRKGVGSTASAISEKDYVYTNTIKTINSALERRKITGTVESVGKPNNYVRIKYSVPEGNDQPKVSIIIPTRDYLGFLKKCVDGLLNETNYENFEIIILDNESRNKKTLNYLSNLQENERVKVIKVCGKFNYSHINNIGVGHASGEFVLFLNNDVKPINKNWLKEMVSHGIRTEVGCVGAKLLYDDNTIQHGGVVLGLGGLAGHAFRKFPKCHVGYGSRLSLVQNYSAVTAACLLMKIELFKKIEGFNATNLKVAFNDVDLCLRVKEQGYRNVWTPFAILYHYESASRGDDLSGEKLKRYNKEADYMRKKWKKYLDHDPAYNPNLTLDREDFSLGRPRFKS